MAALAGSYATTVLPSLGLDPQPSALIAAVKRGLPVSTFSALATALDISEAALSGIAGISATTLARRKRSGQLSPDESEHVLRIAALLDRAAEVFDDLKVAREWLASPNPSLGGPTPLAYADTEIGSREVEQLLGRIEYGVYS